MGTTATATGGIWSIGVTLVEGANTFTAVSTDAASNPSLPSSEIIITLDSTAPVITTQSQTVNDDSFTITGTAEPGSTVRLNQDGNILPNTITVPSDGIWSIEVTLVAGENRVFCFIL